MSKMSVSSSRRRFRTSANWTKSINTAKFCPRGGIRL